MCGHIRKHRTYLKQLQECWEILRNIGEDTKRSENRGKQNKWGNLEKGTFWKLWTCMNIWDTLVIWGNLCKKVSLRRTGLFLATSKGKVTITVGLISFMGG